MVKTEKWVPEGVVGREGIGVSSNITITCMKFSMNKKNMIFLNRKKITISDRLASL